MTDAAGRTFRVIVMPHATTRFRERFPEESAGLHTATLIERIREEVTDALNDGRRKARVPRWVDRWNVRNLPRLTGTSRYVWTEDEQRAYVLVREEGNDGRGHEYTATWKVLTTLRRMTDDDLHSAGQQEKAIRQLGAVEKRKLRDRRARAIKRRRR